MTQTDSFNIFLYFRLIPAGLTEKKLFRNRYNEGGDGHEGAGYAEQGRGVGREEGIAGLNLAGLYVNYVVLLEIIIG